MFDNKLTYVAVWHGKIWPKDTGVMMATLVFDIALPAERLLAVYQGFANRVQVRSRDGRTISLPAHHLRAFQTHEGVYGSFVMEFTDSGELVSLRRLA